MANYVYQPNAAFLFRAKNENPDFHPFAAIVAKSQNKRVPNQKAPKKKRGK